MRFIQNYDVCWLTKHFQICDWGKTQATPHYKNKRITRSTCVLESSGRDFSFPLLGHELVNLRRIQRVSKQKQLGRSRKYTITKQADGKAIKCKTSTNLIRPSDWFASSHRNLINILQSSGSRTALLRCYQLLHVRERDKRNFINNYSQGFPWTLHKLWQPKAVLCLRIIPSSTLPLPQNGKERFCALLDMDTPQS